MRSEIALPGEFSCGSTKSLSQYDDHTSAQCASEVSEFSVKLC